VFDDGATEVDRTISMQPQALAVTSKYLEWLAPARNYQPMRNRRKRACRATRIRLRRTVLWIWAFARRRTHRAIRSVIFCVEVRRFDTHASRFEQNQFLSFRVRQWQPQVHLQLKLANYFMGTDKSVVMSTIDAGSRDRTHPSSVKGPQERGRPARADHR